MGLEKVKTGRLISVDALIDAHCGECAFYHDGKCHALFPCDFRRFIDEDVAALPTVDAIPIRHGRWIYHIDGLFPSESTQECSICHEHEYVTLCHETYCPNCGAKMDGEA